LLVSERLQYSSTINGVSIHGVVFMGSAQLKAEIEALAGRRVNPQKRGAPALSATVFLL